MPLAAAGILTLSVMRCSDDAVPGLAGTLGNDETAEPPPLHADNATSTARLQTEWRSIHRYHAALAWFASGSFAYPFAGLPGFRADDRRVLRPLREKVSVDIAFHGRARFDAGPEIVLELTPFVLLEP